MVLLIKLYTFDPPCSNVNPAKHRRHNEPLPVLPGMSKTSHPQKLKTIEFFHNSRLIR